MKRLSRKRLIIAAVAAALVVWVIASVASGARHIPYEVVSRSDGYELRRYGEFTAAQVVVAGTMPGALDEGVQILEHYFGGENLRQPIVITTVRGRTEEASVQINPDDPVMYEEADGRVTVSFILPGPFTPDDAPRPLDPRVRLISIPERSEAVRVLSGRASAGDVARGREELRSLLLDDGRLILSQFRVARYGPRWSFLRRNEIHVSVR